MIPVCLSTPREERLCPCGMLQTEEHMLFHCEKTSFLWRQYPTVSGANSIADMFSMQDQSRLNDMAIFCYKVLNEYAM